MAAPQRRPIWLLSQPVRLETVSLVPEGAFETRSPESMPPARFRLASQSGSPTHEVVKAYGPERIETAWWRGPTVRRDYYVVETRSGDRYWIFRRLGSGSAGRPGSEWFLHGTFA
jgi:protein ImuB